MAKLFDPIVAEDKLHPSFKFIRDQPDSHPGKAMLEEIFAEFEDTDGNFLEQFQTTGFDARFFELYVFAFLRREGYEIDSTHQYPDFIAERGGERVAIEVTTVNRSDKDIFTDEDAAEEITDEQRKLLEENEYPLRFGGPLFNKLRKRYWELDHCKGIPLVIFIQAHFDSTALALSDAPIASYVFGLRQDGTWDNEGKLEITTEEIEAHLKAGEPIPSGFFKLPDSENISAVVFTNNGTLGKFDRLGYLHGYGNDEYLVSRYGFAFTPDPDVRDPSLFSFEVSQAPVVESWGEGLSVLLNPSAVHPLPQHFLGPVTYTAIEKDVPASEWFGWSPISTRTMLTPMPKELIEYRRGPYFAGCIMVQAISKAMFDAIVGFEFPMPMVNAVQEGWYADEARGFLGVLVHDLDDDDWNCIILARDEMGVFRAIDTLTSIGIRREAMLAIQDRIRYLALAPKRYFKNN